jgi:hypothetical protein
MPSGDDQDRRTLVPAGNSRVDRHRDLKRLVVREGIVLRTPGLGSDAFGPDVHGGPLGNLDFGRFAGARPRAASRGPSAPRDHGLCSPRPWRARLAVRETSEGMDLPGSLRRSPGAIQWIVIR